MERRGPANEDKAATITARTVEEGRGSDVATGSASGREPGSTTQNNGTSSSSSSSSGDSGPGWIGKAVLLLIVAQNVLHVLCTRYSRLPDQPKYNAGVMVLCYELTKLVACTGMVAVTEPAPLQHIWQKVVTEWDVTLKVALPAVLYVVQNTLLFVAISELPAPVFLVLYQFKLITTALFSVLLLGRSFSRTQWASLGGLVVGLGTVQVGASTDRSDGEEGGGSVLGLGAVLACCVLSAFCGVWYAWIWA